MTVWKTRSFKSIVKANINDPEILDLVIKKVNVIFSDPEVQWKSVTTEAIEKRINQKEGKAL